LKESAFTASILPTAVSPARLAATCIDNGCPLDVIGQLLGHATLDTTAHYAQVSTHLMMTAYTNAHPHARGEMKKAAEEPSNA